MAGGTLVVSREVFLHSHYKKRLESLGYRDVAVTATESDGLTMLIRELKPRIVFVESDFYDCASPYMIGLLVRRFRKIYFAVFSRGRYPADLGMWLIHNGVKSFLYYPDGPEQFYQGFERIRNGENYISPSVQERFDMRANLPNPAVELTEREKEVARLVSNGFTGDEIAVTLQISLRTVNFHKRELYNNLGVRNENELIRVAAHLGIIDMNELTFYGRNYELSPKPRNKVRGKREKVKEKYKLAMSS